MDVFFYFVFDHLKTIGPAHHGIINNIFNKAKKQKGDALVFVLSNNLISLPGYSLQMSWTLWYHCDCDGITLFILLLQRDLQKTMERKIAHPEIDLVVAVGEVQKDVKNAFPVIFTLNV